MSSQLMVKKTIQCCSMIQQTLALKEKQQPAFETVVKRSSPNQKLSKDVRHQDQLTRYHPVIDEDMTSGKRV